VSEARQADPAPWYREGLRFTCTRCGHCCSGTPGTVLVSDAEIEALARRVELPPAAFRKVYTRRLRRGAISLRERRNGQCIFFQPGAGCTVYPDRPRQCRTWPFWRGVVHSPQRWAEEAEHCPGMNHGHLHAPEEIQQLTQNDGTSGKGGERGDVPSEFST